MEPAPEIAIRLEILNEFGIDTLINQWAPSVLPATSARPGKMDFRAGVTVYGEVAYVAKGLFTPNPVRLGGLPCDCELAICIMPPTTLPLDEATMAKPLLTTAVLPLEAMQASAVHDPQETLPNALFWQDWLPLATCDGSVAALDHLQLLDLRIQVSILFEEPLSRKSLPATPLATQLSNSICSEEWNDMNLERSQSYRLLTSRQHSENIQHTGLRNSLEETIPVPTSGKISMPPIRSNDRRTHNRYSVSSLALTSPTSTIQDTSAVLSAPSSPSQLSSARIVSTTNLQDAIATSREQMLHNENVSLRAELARSQEEAAMLRRHHEEDRRRVQDKLRELEDEVRGRWLKKVSDLQAEVTYLRKMLGRSSPSMPNQALNFGAGVRASIGFPNGPGVMNQSGWQEAEKTNPLVEGPRLNIPAGPFSPEFLNSSDLMMPSWPSPGVGSPPLDAALMTPMRNVDGKHEGKWHRNVPNMQQSTDVSNKNSSTTDQFPGSPWLSQQPSQQSLAGSNGIGLQPPIGLHMPKLRFPAMGNQGFNTRVSTSIRDVNTSADWLPEKHFGSHQRDSSPHIQRVRSPPRKGRQDEDLRDGNSPNGHTVEFRAKTSRPPSPPRPSSPRNRMQMRQDVKWRALEREPEKWNEERSDSSISGNDQRSEFVYCRSRSDPTLPHRPGTDSDERGFSGFLNSFSGIYDKVYGAMQGKDDIFNGIRNNLQGKER